MMAPAEPRTADGFDMQMGTNHLGHFLFTRLLVPLLKDTAAKTGDVRVVTLSSTAHIFTKVPLRLHDLNWARRDEFTPLEAYAQSKLANIHFSRELGVRMAGTGVSTSAVHPGVVATELNRYCAESSNLVARLFHVVFYKVLGFFIKTPWHGTQTTLYCALSDEMKGVSGKFYSDSAEMTPSDSALMKGNDAKLWELSDKLTGCEGMAI